MTVKELIQELYDLPQDATITVNESGWGAGGTTTDVSITWATKGGAHCASGIPKIEDADF